MLSLNEIKSFSNLIIYWNYFCTFTSVLSNIFETLTIKCTKHLSKPVSLVSEGHLHTVKKLCTAACQHLAHPHMFLVLCEIRVVDLSVHTYIHISENITFASISLYSKQRCARLPFSGFIGEVNRKALILEKVVFQYMTLTYTVYRPNTVYKYSI